MKYLFFFVHPSKFYLFRDTINHLKSQGHDVEIVITSKDVLEDLVKSEGWEYSNIFPNGRKGNKLPGIIYTIYNFFLTIYRLWKHTKGKEYHLFITDDLLVFVGKLRNIPSIVFLDDDIEVVRPFSLILSRATHVLSPDVTNIGKFNSKKIPFPGYKELAYLHPNNFKPDKEIIQKINPEGAPYFVVRLVNLTAYHDIGKKGISDHQIRNLIELLDSYGKVFITSERRLPDDLEHYRLEINPKNISHVLYFADMFIGDSQTMCSEASILGTPTFRCNDFKGKINVMDDKDNYGIMFSYTPLEFQKMYEHIKRMLEAGIDSEEFQKRKEKMLNDKMDVNKFLKWLLSNYPSSVNEMNKSKFTYNNFK